MNLNIIIDNNLPDTLLYWCGHDWDLTRPQMLEGLALCIANLKINKKEYTSSYSLKANNDIINILLEQIDIEYNKYGT